MMIYMNYKLINNNNQMKIIFIISKINKNIQILKMKINNYKITLMKRIISLTIMNKIQSSKMNILTA